MGESLERGKVRMDGEERRVRGEGWMVRRRGWMVRRGGWTVRVDGEEGRNEKRYITDGEKLP